MSMLAYQVKEELQGYATIVFAAKAAQARKRGAEELDADLSDVSAERAAWADRYAPGPVPVRARLEEGGWWFDCSCGCGLEVEAGAEDDGRMCSPVYEGDLVYWNAEHKERAERSAQTDGLHDAIEAVAVKFPFANVVEVVRTSAGEIFVGMSFPGAAGQARWLIGSSEVELDEADVCAWQACLPGSEVLGPR